MIITTQFSTIVIFLLFSFILGLFFGYRARSDRRRSRPAGSGRGSSFQRSH